jgi:hypothetical protein
VQAGRLQLDLARVCPTDRFGRPPANLKEFRYYLAGIFRTALAHDEARRYSSAGGLGADIQTVTALIAPPRGWAALKARLANLISPRGVWSPSPASRPLSAVLRKRVAMALEAEDHNLLQEPPAAESD